MKLIEGGDVCLENGSGVFIAVSMVDPYRLPLCLGLFLLARIELALLPVGRLSI